MSSLRKVISEHHETQRHLRLLPSIYIRKNTAGQYNVIIQIHEKECFVFMCMGDYSLKINEFCCHGVLFLWQLQHLTNMVCLSNTIAVATIARFLLKITANLIDKMCYYASHTNEHFF